MEDENSFAVRKENEVERRNNEKSKHGEWKMSKIDSIKNKNQLKVCKEISLKCHKH